MKWKNKQFFPLSWPIIWMTLHRIIRVLPGLKTLPKIGYVISFSCSFIFLWTNFGGLPQRKQNVIVRIFRKSLITVK